MTTKICVPCGYSSTSSTSSTSGVLNTFSLNISYGEFNGAFNVLRDNGAAQRIVIVHPTLVALRRETPQNFIASYVDEYPKSETRVLRGEVPTRSQNNHPDSQCLRCDRKYGSISLGHPTSHGVR
ncbi:unnamed protein product [Somion occarium]|uniref:Uncharacterized protein n=1 Tax=Somion occarium TaxID=3059160 RepID=A0ABP1DW88_9APHY